MTSFTLLCCITCCHLLGFATSFQQRFAPSPTALQGITDGGSKYRCSQSRLFAKTSGARRATVWNEKYQQLREFYIKNGHSRVERGHVLYSWVITQRRKRKNRKVESFMPHTEEQIRLLDEIDFPWETRTGPRDGLNHRKWMARYEELAEFYNKHGHFLMEDTKSSLYMWMRTQRTRGNGWNKALSPLTDDQIQLLDAIDFPWKPERRGFLRKKSWNKKYAKLAEFYKTHGHVRLERDSDPSLYRWAVVQRMRLRGGTDIYPPLSDEQAQMLEKLDFSWNVHGKKWNMHYEKLAQFYKKNGNFSVEYRSPLYNWMGTQRKRRKGGRGHAPLSDKQIELLDEIDFPWNVRTGPKDSSHTLETAKSSSVVEDDAAHSVCR